MKLLLVEDDRMVGGAVQKGLREEGFVVDWVQDGRAAELALLDGDYALVLLDLGLPRKSGLDLLAAIRARGKTTPVLILTARDTLADRVAGLDSGADDYLAKPFQFDELAARVRALLRRSAGRAAPMIQHGQLCVDPASHRVTLGGQEIALSNKEFALLSALIDRPGSVVSRQQLEARLYGWDEEVESNAVEVHIHNLRKKLGADVIRNVRGVGYMVSAPA